MSGGKRLLSVFRTLSPARQAALVEYAEFLASREDADTTMAPPSEPLPIPRPDEESIVKAIQRLMQTYPMLDRNRVFHEASAQMTRHLIHGVSASDAIDELEIIFRRHYQSHRETPDTDPQ